MATQVRGPDRTADSLAVDDRLPLWTSVIAGMRQEQHRVFVATDGTCVLGFASTGPAGTTTWGQPGSCTRSTSCPRAWASGVGSALMDALMDAVAAACPDMECPSSLIGSATATSDLTHVRQFGSWDRL
jgi:hypothetical protein